MQTEILDQYPDADIAAAMVWIDMLPDDGTEAAERRASEFPRAIHFHDEEKRAGMAVAQTLRRHGRIAWDVYLLWPDGPRWDARLPAPAEWVHQLSGSGFDEDRFRTGHELRGELHQAFQRIMTGGQVAKTR